MYSSVSRGGKKELTVYPGGGFVIVSMGGAM